MHEICGTARAELACGAGRTGSVEADGNYVGKENSGAFGGNLETIRNLAEADFGSLLGKSGMLAETFDEKTLLLIHQRIVDGRSAKIYSRYDWHAVSPLHSSMFVWFSVAEFSYGYLRKW